MAGAKKDRLYTGALALLLAAALFFHVLFPPAAVEAQLPLPPAEEPRYIALTFDDGPRRATTARLLDGLRDRGVPATFFLIGSQLAGQEDLVLRMEAEGHQIGLHTYDHTALTGLNGADFAAQVDRTRSALQALLGRSDFLLRPPYGAVDDAVLRLAQTPIVLWSVDPEDWGDRDAGREVRHILQNAKDGSVVLLHDIYPQSVDAALAVVDALRAEGWVFLTVEDLFAARGMALEPGRVYRHAYPDDPGQWYP